MPRRNASWENAYLVHTAKIENLRYDCHFVTTNDTYVWKDTPNESAVTAAFKSDKTIADTISHNRVDDVSWTTVEVKSGFEARIRGEEETAVEDTPGRAVEGLSFPETYDIKREQITNADEVETQIVDILKSLNGAVNVQTIPEFLNYQSLDIEEITIQETTEKLIKMEEHTNAYRTRGNDTNWWSAQ